MAHSLNNYRSQGVSFHNYYSNGEREIIHASAKRNQKSYTWCLEPYYDIAYVLNAHDWHYVALVSDRILLIIFTGISLSRTIVI
ncbi:unnamed protein product [Rotaria sp. Silwood1]|nr:unnamed protein product [Rotaria sp. Silwood1]CAF3733954.1 unnamed protein product [Rotaria sp. Silwood1]CAF3748970.1 unnamed protein product [Rotaria sp. Silwood1]CAF4567037.1 unnamed protein product [Rotaria sp. Silwood1]CAF4844636.1 unnamed protein product [Rotaria sp. Silwood1]